MDRVSAAGAGAQDHQAHRGHPQALHDVPQEPPSLFPSHLRREVAAHPRKHLGPRVADQLMAAPGEVAGEGLV